MKNYFVHYKETVASEKTTTTYDFETVVANSSKDAELRLLKRKLHELNNGLMICQVWNGTIFATDLKGEATTFEIIITEEAW